VHEGAGGGGGADAAACVTVKLRPAIVSDPVRDVLLFAAIVNATEPLPVPLAPDVIEIHDAPLLAVHRHPVCVVTAAVPLPPLAATFWLVGETV
jgi:hypothetical protein